jgi:hypothetical protein
VVARLRGPRTEIVPKENTAHRGGATNGRALSREENRKLTRSRILIPVRAEDVGGSRVGKLERLAVGRELPRSIISHKAVSDQYGRDHFRALAQRVEVADREVRIIGSKSNLLHTLTFAAGAKAGYCRRSQFCSEVAERGGFEPPVPARAHVISSHAG